MLGFTIENGSRKIDPQKAEAFRNWPEPQCVGDVVSFLAFANYIREFLVGFLEDSRPLRPLQKERSEVQLELGQPQLPPCVPDDSSSFSRKRGASLPRLERRR